MKRLLLAVFLLAGCVAPAVGASVCASQTTVTANQVETTGTGFTVGGTVRFQAVLPDSTVIDQSFLTEGGTIQFDLRWMPGAYTIGPITDLTNPACVVNAYQFVAANPTAAPSVRETPTVPPTPNITLPPTDTE